MKLAMEKIDKNTGGKDNSVSTIRCKKVEGESLRVHR